MLTVLCLITTVFVEGAVSAVINVSKYGRDTPSCGESTHGCFTIKHAIMNMSSPGDSIHVHGHPHQKETTYNEQNILVSKRLYIRGVHGKVTISCNNCDTIFHLTSADRVYVDNIWFSGGLREVSRKDNERKTTVFEVHNTKFKLSNCHFDNFPYVIRFQGDTRDELRIFNCIFIRPVSAIHVQRFCRYLRLEIRDCQFIGQSDIPGNAVKVEYQINEVCLQVHGGLAMYVYNSSFCYFSRAIVVDVLNVKAALVLINASTFESNKAKHRIRSFTNIYQEDSAGITFSAIHPSLRKLRKLIIVNSKFINNTSLYGGGLKVLCQKGITVNIKKSNFTDNRAISGGGAIYSSGECDVTIKSSFFLRNKCYRGHYQPNKPSFSLFGPYGVGGAITLYVYQLLRFGAFQEHPRALIMNCEFRFNSADYSGGAIYSNFHTLYIERTVIETSHKNLPYDADSGLIRSKYRCLLINVSLFVGNAKDSRNAALLGESAFALRVDKESKFTCPEGSILSYKKMGNFKFNSIPGKKSILKTFMMFAFHCITCPPNYYNSKPSILMNWTLSTKKCYKCPPGGICKAGILQSKSNFWGFQHRKSDRVDFFQLPEGYGCKKPQCIGINSCAIGRTGSLCGTCGTGLTESMLSTECIKNEKCNFAAFWSLACFLFLSYMIFFIFKKEVTSLFSLKHFKCRQNFEISERGVDNQTDSSVDDVSLKQRNERETAECEDKNIHDAKLGTAIIKIVFYFFQAESILSTLGYNAIRSPTLDVGRSLSNFFNFNFFRSKVDWTCGLYNVTPVVKILIHLVFIASLLLALALVYVLVWVVNTVKSRMTQPLIMKNGKLSVANKIVVASFEIFLLNYSLFANSIFKLLRCVKISDRLFLRIQGNIICYQEWQYLLMVLGLGWAAPFCIFVFVLPWLLLVRQFNRRELLIGCVFPLPVLIVACFKSSAACRGYESISTSFESEEGKEDGMKECNDAAMAEIFKNRVDPFSASINKKLYLSWEGVYILRRLVLVICDSFITDPVQKLYAMLMSQIVFLLHRVIVKPYAAQSMNHLETVCLTVLVIINSTNLLPAYDYSHGIEEESKHRILLQAVRFAQPLVGILLPFAMFLCISFFILAHLLRILVKLASKLLRKLCK